MDFPMELETLLLHADGDPEDPEPDGGPVAPALHPSVPFSAGSAEEFARRVAGGRAERFYRRDGSPTQARLERALAAAEGAEAGLATASGMGAVTMAVLTLVSGGEHVVAQQSMYAGTLSLLRDLAPRFGVEVSFVDQADTPAFERAMRPDTRLVMLESPSNPLLRLTDLSAVTAMAREHGALSMVDNTVATPVNQRPLEHGVDLVMHSLTKAISGHSDVLAGALLGRAELIERIWHTHLVTGSVISPFDAWLTLRGLRTLPMRVRAQNGNALAVARFLDGHPAVRAVHYPGLPGHPQHELAGRQMSGFGGLLSVELRGGYQAASGFIDRLRLPARAASLGGVRSLVVQPAAMWTNELIEEQLADAGVPPGLVRIAVGVEHERDLVADLDQALAGS